MPASTREQLITALARDTDAFDAPPRPDLTFTRRLVAALARYTDDDLAPATSSGWADPDWSALPADVTETVSEGTLRDQVQAVVAAMQRTTPDQLVTDTEGDINIRAGTAIVFVRTRDDPPLVDVFSPLLTEVKPRMALYERLSEFTDRMAIGRLYYANGTVWASVPVFGRDLQPSHLTLAVQVMTGLADELDNRLHGEFGGRRFLPKEAIPSSKVPPASGEPASDATVIPPTNTPRAGTEAPDPITPAESPMPSESTDTHLGSTAKRLPRGPMQVAKKRRAARAAVLYRGRDITITTAFVDIGGTRFLLADIGYVERVEYGSLLQPQRYELWAWAGGQRVLLFSSDDAAEFGQVARALTRAREYAGLA